ncbi:MAG TPA: tail fiber domain-containing protein, partial [Phnomibacter sp.]|nr:tail fiber domain-containing protein [Phnomibacter sp.]
MSTHMHFYFTIVFLSIGQLLPAQNVGIGTTEPKAMLHVADSAVLFSAAAIIPDVNSPDVPVSGSGIRMMWYPARAAFRAGRVSGNHWNKANLGTASFAAGDDVIASAHGTVALGSSAWASSNFAIAIGYAATASAGGSVALGHGSMSSGYGAIGLGYNTQAKEVGSAAIAFGSIAEGYASVAAGNMAKTTATGATALGTGTLADTYGQTSVGTFNLPYNGGNLTMFAPTDPVFVVGNGSHNASRSNALTILKNGNTGIGILQPQAKLQVNGQLMLGNGTPQATLHVEGNQIVRRNSYTGSAHIVLEETQGGDGSRLQFRNSTISGKFWDLFGFTHASSPADAYFNIYYETVGNTMSLRGNGNVTFKGTVSQNSDARLKKDIEPLYDPAGKLQRISGYRYHWKNEAMGAGWQTGLLAQEVEAVIPELVTTADDGTK